MEIMRGWEPEEDRSRSQRGVQGDLVGGKELERNGKREWKDQDVNQVDCFKLFNYNVEMDVTNGAQKWALQVCVSLYNNHSCEGLFIELKNLL